MSGFGGAGGIGGGVNQAQAKALIADQRPDAFIEIEEGLVASDQYGQYPTIEEGVARATYLRNVVGLDSVEVRVRAGNFVQTAEWVLEDYVTLSADEGANIDMSANTPRGITLNKFANLRGLNLTLSGNYPAKSSIYFDGADGWDGTIETLKVVQTGQRKAIFEFGNPPGAQLNSGGFVSRADLIDLNPSGVGNMILGSGKWQVGYFGCNITQLGGSPKDIIKWTKGNLTANQIIGIFYNSALTNFSFGDFFNFDDAFIQVHCQGTFGAPFDLLTLINAPDGVDQVLVTREDAIEQYSYPETGRSKGTLGRALSEVKDHLALADAEREINRSNLSIIATGTEFQLGVLPGEFDGQIVQNFINQQQIQTLFGAVVEDRLLQAKETINVDDFELYRSTPLTGNTTAIAANHLIDSGALFQTNNVQIGEVVKNTTTLNIAYVVAVNSEIDLTLSADIFPAPAGDGYQIGEISDEWVTNDPTNTIPGLIPTGGADEGQYLSISFNANLSSGDFVEKTYETPQDWSTFDRLLIRAFGSGDSLSAPVRILVTDDNSNTAFWEYRYYPSGDWIEYEFYLNRATVSADFKWWAIEKIRFEAGTIAPGVTGTWDFDLIVACTTAEFSGTTLDTMDSLTNWTHTGAGSMTLGTSNPREGTGYLVISTGSPANFQIKRTWPGGGTYAPIIDADEVMRIHYRSRNVTTPGAFNDLELILKDESGNTLRVPPFGVGFPIPRKIESSDSEWSPYEWYYRDGELTEPSPPFDITKIIEVEIRSGGASPAGIWDVHIDWLESGGIAYCLSTVYDLGEAYNQIRAICSFGGYDPYKSGGAREQNEDIRVMISSTGTFKFSDFASGKAISIKPYEIDPAKEFGAWIPVVEHLADPNKLTFKVVARRLSLVAGVGIQFRYVP